MYFVRWRFREIFERVILLEFFWVFYILFRFDLVFFTFRRVRFFFIVMVIFMCFCLFRIVF